MGYFQIMHNVILVHTFIEIGMHIDANFCKKANEIFGPLLLFQKLYLFKKLGCSKW